MYGKIISMQGKSTAILPPSVFYIIISNKQDAFARELQNVLKRIVIFYL